MMQTNGIFRGKRRHLLALEKASLGSKEGINSDSSEGNFMSEGENKNLKAFSLNREALLAAVRRILAAVAHASRLI